MILFVLKIANERIGRTNNLLAMSTNIWPSLQHMLGAKTLWYIIIISFLGDKHWYYNLLGAIKSTLGAMYDISYVILSFWGLQ